MAAITWGETESRLYETGVDRGVLYLSDESGLPWNGLINVEVTEGTKATSSYFDGKKYLVRIDPAPPEAKVRSYAYPEAFGPYSGYEEVQDGLSIDGQPKQPFGLSYRTLLGDADVGHELGYKIHILYNMTANPDGLDHETYTDSPDPSEFSWTAEATPEPLEGYSPTAHVIVDSRYITSGRLTQLETILYGSEDHEPRLPPLSVLVELLSGAYTIVILDNGDGTWTAEGPNELITMLDDVTFEITDVNAIYADADTYAVSST